jgi:uracil-DNA glycosylase
MNGPILAGPSNALRQPLGQHLAQACEAWPGDAACASVGDWAPLVRSWTQSPAGQALIAAVEQRQARGAVVYPAQVLRALALTPLDSVRVLILGQDPYHGPGQAQGLAFSVPAHSRLPPSLRNILQELQRDLGAVSAQAASGDLGHWARQGVLLLNTSLTVEDGQAGSHARLGWDALTDALVQAVAQRHRPLVALLWGAHAQAKAALLGGAGHPKTGPAAAARLVLACNHPSPLAARRPPVPFIGCGHFSQTQAFLQAHDPTRPPVQW